MSKIDKKTIDHLASLARFEITSKEEKEGLLKDFQNIIDYFDSLSEVDVSGVDPIIGGSFHEDSHRSDDSLKDRIKNEDPSKDFPETEDGYNKVPKIFNK